MPQRKPEHRSTQNTLDNADAEDIPIINMSCCVADNRSKGARKCGKTDLTRGNIHPLTQKGYPSRPKHIPIDTKQIEWYGQQKHQKNRGVSEIKLPATI